MRRRDHLVLTFAGELALAAAVTLALMQSAFAQTQDRELVSAGKMVAQRYCGECHAVERGKVSPLTDAPPMWTLHRRFPVDRMAEALELGMLNDHPRMPDFRLEIDERRALTAYLSSFRPRTPPPQPKVSRQDVSYRR